MNGENALGPRPMIARCNNLRLTPLFKEIEMTTKVTVDAHAGWPVLVVQVVGEPNAPKSIRQDVVEPNTTKDFYIHSGMRIISIEELPR